MTQKTLLITRPFYEIPTNYLYHWSRSLIKLAESKKFNVIDLSREKANRKEIEGRLKKLSLDLVILNGHGSEKAIYGNAGKELIIAGENSKLLSNKIVYARSCLSAKVLGKVSVKNGTLAYIGYDQDFIFIYDKDYVMKPLKDKTATLFFGPSNQTARSLIKGNTAGQANESGKAAFLKTISSLSTSETSKEDTEAIRYLLWDMHHQVCLGDENAKV